MEKTIVAIVLALTGLTLPALALAQTQSQTQTQAKPKPKPKPKPPEEKGLSYADEDRDWGIAPTTRLRTEDSRAPTPLQVPGGRVVRTVELQKMLAAKERPYLVDVLPGSHRTLAGAFWMEGGGSGTLNKDQEKRFLKAMAGFAGGKKNRPVVFFCDDAQCWLAYNAARRAIAAGYTNIMWYRGGTAAWRAAGLPMSQADPFAW